MANKTGNITWIAGGESPNKYGRKLARQTITAAIERFVKKNLTEKKLQTFYDHLTPKEQFQLLIMLTPYILPKKSDEGVTREEIEAVRQMLEHKMAKHG